MCGPPLVTVSTALPSVTAVAISPPAVDDIVMYGVLEQVGDQPFYQHRVSISGAGPVSSSIRIPSRSISPWRSAIRRGDGRSEIDELVSSQPALAACEGE